MNPLTTDWNTDSGELTVWTAPPLPPAATQNIIYVTQKSRQSELAVGACEKLIINPLHQDEGYSLFNPTRHANVYMSQYKNKVGLSGVDFFDSIAKITLLRRPDKGEIRLVDDLPVSYMPKDRDQGIDDSFIVQVEQYGVRIKVHYSVLIDSSNEINLVDCYGAPVGNNGLWKISQSYTDPSTRESAAWLRSAQLSALLASASQSLTGYQNLSGTAVGETVGEGSSAKITLDTNAAGHNWYIDPNFSLDGAVYAMPNKPIAADRSTAPLRAATVRPLMVSVKRSHSLKSTVICLKLQCS